MDFDQHIFAGLGRYLSPGVHFCPIKYSSVVVKLALRGEQLRLRKRMIGNNRGYIPVDQPLLGSYPPQCNDVLGKDLWALVDVIDHVDVMGIVLRSDGCGLTEVGGQVTCLEIMSDDIGAVCFYKFL